MANARQWPAAAYARGQDRTRIIVWRVDSVLPNDRRTVNALSSKVVSRSDKRAAQVGGDFPIVSGRGGGPGGGGRQIVTTAKPRPFQPIGRHEDPMRQGTHVKSRRGAWPDAVSHRLFKGLSSRAVEFRHAVWLFIGLRLAISGAEGSRTLDLCIANAALSQLSYRPPQLAQF